MSNRRLAFVFVLPFCLLASLPAHAQLPPVKPDPLARMQAVTQGAGSCSATEPSLCAEATPKIIANALGP